MTASVLLRAGSRYHKAGAIGLSHGCTYQGRRCVSLLNLALTAPTDSDDIVQVLWFSDYSTYRIKSIGTGFLHPLWDTC